MDRVVARSDFADPDSLGAHLRRLFPRVRIRARQIAHESDVWYVYRDGGWRPDSGLWWLGQGVPRIVIDASGWIREADPVARGLLGLGAELGRHRLAEFVAAEMQADAAALYEIVNAGHDLDATLRIRPLTGDVIACQLHAAREGDRLVVSLQLADDITVTGTPAGVLPTLSCQPGSDVVFARYATRTLQGIADPTPDELAIRLRRLYPHAQVLPNGDGWQVLRDRGPEVSIPTRWWEDPDLPRVSYDDRGLILEANEAALQLIHPELVGRHWHEFVTPGSTEQVGAVIDLIRTAGWAESRFRMPGADGGLIEFDSVTWVDGETLTTVIRPVADAVATGRSTRPSPARRCRERPGR